MSVVIGLIMLAGLFAFIAAMLCSIMTVKDAIIIFAVSCIGTAWIVCACYLIAR